MNDCHFGYTTKLTKKTKNNTGMYGSVFFFYSKILPKRIIKYSIFNKDLILEVFSVTRSERGGKKENFFIFIYFGLSQNLTTYKSLEMIL